MPLLDRPNAGDSLIHGTGTAAPAAAVTVPIIEDVAVFGTRTTDQGGYRISKSVSAEAATVEASLESVSIAIERRPIGTLLAPGAEAPATRTEGDVLVLSVVEEVLVTEKRLRLVEEVRVTRNVRTRLHVEELVLRKERVSIERLAAEDAPASNVIERSVHDTDTILKQPEGTR